MKEINILWLFAHSKVIEKQIARSSFIDEEMKALAKRGFKIHCLCPYIDKIKLIEGIKIHPVPEGKKNLLSIILNILFILQNFKEFHPGLITNLKVVYKIAKIERIAQKVIKKENIRLIHSHFLYPKGSGGNIANKKANLPLIISLHGVDVDIMESIGYGNRLNRFYDRLSRNTLQKADKIIAISNYIKERSISMGASINKCEIIMKGVDLERFNPTIDGKFIRMKLKAENRPFILCVAYLVPFKSIDTLIMALPKVLKTFSKALLVICGKGSEYQRLKDLVDNLSLTKNVIFAGVIEQKLIPQYFSACDIFVLPSISEAFGIVYIEAMACAKPVICCSVGGPPEYIIDGVTGYTVRPKDSDTLAEKIITLLQNRELQEKMGKAGRQRVEKYFDFNKVIDRYIEIYTSLL